jgi:hypothetical protein
MFFTRDSEINSLKKQIHDLEIRISVLAGRVEIEQKRVDALFKLYPYGLNKDGSPRKKLGRPHKKEAA